MALAETLTMVVGEFDLSVGYVSSLAGVMFIGFMVNRRMGFLEALLLTLVVAAGFGLCNGIIVAKLGVNALIGTLGVGIAAVGVNYLYGGGATMAGTLPNVVTQLGIGSAGLSSWLGCGSAWPSSSGSTPNRPVPASVARHRWQPARFSSGRSPGVPAQVGGLHHGRRAGGDRWDPARHTAWQR